MTDILVTRPEPDAADTAGKLKALGLCPTVFPLMRMEISKTRLPEPGGLSGLIVTSANALRALEQRDALAPYLGLPLFAVGEKTATTATALGFSEVTNADGDANALIDLIGAKARPGSYFYPCASETAHNLPEALAGSGLVVLAAETYAMQAVTRLSGTVAAELRRGKFAAALVYSRRSAALFAELTESVLTPERKRALTLVCLSENTAEPLVLHGFPRIVLADFPSEEAMMAATLSFSRGQITS